MKKNKRIKLLAGLLSLLLLAAFALSSCGVQKADTLLTLEGETISVYTYQLMLARLKGNLAYSLSVQGYNVNGDTFWDQIIDLSGTTYAQFFSDAVLKTLQQYLIAAYLFDKVYGLTLPDATVASIDENLQELMTYDSDGNKNAFNKILADFGTNYKYLRETYLLEAKQSALVEYLYGTDGAKLTDTVKNDYYQQHYVCFKQIVLNNYYYVTSTDEDGNEVTVDADGDGYDDVANYTPTQKNAIAARANELLAILNEHPGDEVTFEYYMTRESDDTVGRTEFPDGYFLCDTLTYSGIEDMEYLPEMQEKLAEMAVGDVALITADDGWHIIRKYELPEGAYGEDYNEPWFSDMVDAICDEMFVSVCDGYADKVEINDLALQNAMTIKDVSPNYFY